jgi:hypothetical protein
MIGEVYEVVTLFIPSIGWLNMGAASETTRAGHDRLVFSALFCARFTLLSSCVVCSVHISVSSLFCCAPLLLA